jgi:hypothetical protein
MMSNFAIFIMVHGRPDKMWTYHTLRKQGYTGKIFLVADNLDPTVDEYKEIYGDELLIFDKNKSALKTEAGDNTGDLRSTVFASNEIFDLAKEQGIKYFFNMCDDYTAFYHTFVKNDIDNDYRFKKTRVKNLDKIMNVMLEFYKKTSITTLAMGQGGDFIGGEGSGNADIKLLRKAMNTFLCSTDRPFKFIGRLNEDVTTYVNLGSKGKLFCTTTNLCLIQQMHQAKSGGMTEVHVDNGTYVKSFFSVMYNPSCIKVSTVGPTNPRIHHKIRWNNAVPKILNEKYKN